MAHPSPGWARAPIDFHSTFPGSRNLWTSANSGRKKPSADWVCPMLSRHQENPVVFVRANFPYIGPRSAGNLFPTGTRTMADSRHLAPHWTGTFVIPCQETMDRCSCGSWTMPLPSSISILSIDGPRTDGHIEVIKWENSMDYSRIAKMGMCPPIEGESVNLTISFALSQWTNVSTAHLKARIRPEDW